MSGEEQIKIDWLAVWLAVLALIAVGAWLGYLTTQDDKSIICPREDWVTTSQTSKGVSVYCMDPNYEG